MFLTPSQRDNYDAYTDFVNNYDKMATMLRKYEQNSAFVSLISVRLSALCFPAMLTLVSRNCNQSPCQNSS